MDFRVVCISHTDGSCGDEVSRAVAGRLGFRYVDEELILAAARRAQVDPAIVAATEQKQSLLQRILDALSSAHENLGPATLAAGLAVPTMPVPGSRRASKDDLRSMIRAAIHEVGKAGAAVIAAHAASLALAGKEGVLRVLVTAPEEVRVRRVAEERSVTEKEATELVRTGDEGRREYMRVFYEIEEEQPTHYDLVVNTEILTPAQAAALVVATARG